MTNKRLARLVEHKCRYKCEICENSKLGKMYEYRNVSFVRGYIPHHYKQVCGDCVYKKVYGTNFWKKNKKEGTLDEMLAL